MRVRINIGLDFDGNHTFDWLETADAHAIEIPKSTLDRWTAEREAFTVAYLRWKRVMEEIEDTLYRAEHARSEKEAAAEPALAYAAASGHRRVRG
ncbi:MAG: hypothetical protein HY903_20465 [Deltaproteobacteria bacterium]|nr:hypothetical protein [Deltaproteobacteria bacterium]